MKQKISVKAQNYSSKTFFIEADWSSASYFYAFLALVEKGTITLSNYSAKSLQGDSVLFKLMQNFGVETHFYKNKIQLIKHNVAVNFAVFHYDFSENPDLVQTFVALCIGLNKNAQLTGLESLKIKETDRILALQNECAQFGWSFNTRDNETYFLKPEKQNIAKNKLIVKTYDDHRMAMSFAPLVMKYKALNIENENVVSKSNPLFWEQVKQLGINLCIV